MPLVPLNRLQRDAGADKKPETAAALEELKAKRAERQAKLRMLSETPLPETPPADASAQLEDWGSDDNSNDTGVADLEDATPSPSPTPKPARRLRKLAAASAPTPAAASPDPDLLVAQLGSLSVSRPKRTARSGMPTHGDDDDASASDQDTDSDSGSDSYEAGSDDDTSSAPSALSSPSTATNKSGRPLPSTKPEDLVLDTGFTIPRKIAKDLYAYQVDGLRWLHSLFKQRKGGILGDDMGMGKTRQCAAFIAGLFHSRKAKRVLIVAPATLLQNWKKELKDLGLSYLVVEYHGSATKAREAELQRVQNARGVVLTTYGMVQYNHEKLAAGSRYQANSEEDDDEFRWDCVFLDEGHTVKNPNTKQYKALKGLPVALWVLVTGTPIQNNLVELHALFNLCNDGLLGDARDFKAAFEKPILASHARDATMRVRQLGAAKGDELRKTIRPFFLRREKKDLAQLMGQADQAEGSSKMNKLPAKNDLVVWLRLKPLQEKIYYAFLNSSAVKSALLTNVHVLAALCALNKICNHPALLSKAAEKEMLRGASRLASGQRLEESSDIDEIEESDSDADDLDDFIVDDDEEDESSDDDYAGRRKQKGKKATKGKGKAAGKFKKPQQQKKPVPEDEEEQLNLEELWGEGSMQDLEGQLLADVQQQGWEASCKTTFVLELLKTLKAAGHRVLIFGRSRVMLRIVQAACDGEGIKTIYMDGEVNIKDRDPVVQRFKKDPSITAFLLTTKVGGVGLTLTEADRVIIMEPDWNPSNDSQSVDRAYRIGQDKAVVVYRLITCGTIEEKMYRRQVFKGGLFRTGTEEGLQMRYFSATELRELFTVTPQELRESATQKQLNEKHAHQRKYTPEVAAHLERLQQLHRCNGVHDHDLLFSEKPPEDPELSPEALAELEAQEARERANRSHFGTGSSAAAANDLSALMSQALHLGGQGGASVLTKLIAEAEDDVTVLKGGILRWERNLGLALPDSGAKARQELATLRDRLASAEANLTSLRAQRSTTLLVDLAGPSTSAPRPSTIPNTTFYPAATTSAPHSPTPAPQPRQVTSVTPQGSFAIKPAAPLAPAPASEAFGLRPLRPAGKASPTGSDATTAAARSAAAAAQPRPATLQEAPGLKKPSPLAAKAPTAAAATNPAASSSAITIDDLDTDEIVRLAPRPSAKAPINVLDLTDD